MTAVDVRPQKEAGSPGAQRLHAWRDSLMELSKRNRLLHYREFKSSTLELLGRTPEEVVGSPDRVPGRGGSGGSALGFVVVDYAARSSGAVAAGSACRWSMAAGWSGARAAMDSSDR